MRRAGLAGLPLRRRAKRVPPAKTVTDLVKRDFRRDGPNQLWVTGITEHPAREGKLYCCIVLDAYSRRVVGWAIDSRQRADLATSALGMAIDARGIAGQIPGGITPRRPRHPVHLVDLHRARTQSRPAALPGHRRRSVRQRRRRGVLGTPADRTPRPATPADPRRTRERDLRVHRRVLQPPPTPLRSRLDEPATVRNHHPNVEPDLLTSESVKPGGHQPDHR